MLMFLVEGALKITLFAGEKIFSFGRYMIWGDPEEMRYEETKKKLEETKIELNFIKKMVIELKEKKP